MSETPARPGKIRHCWNTTANVICDRLNIERRADAHHIVSAITRQSEQIASLTKQRDAQLQETQHAWNERDGEKRLRLVTESRLSDLEQEAVKVVGPFGAYLDQANFDLDNNGNQVPDDQGMGWVYLTVGDFRAARAFLDKLRRPS